jgi:hypothetical protein
VADEALTAGAAARRLGVAVTTLRTWHQRYGLGPSQHAPGQHRRYTAEDMDRLQVMRRLTAQGVSAAEAAAWARRVPVPMDVGSSLSPDAGSVSRTDFGYTGNAPQAARDGGGQTIPVGRAGPTARGMARAAMRLDAPALRDIVEMTLTNRGVIRTWEEALLPVLIGIGERYADTKRFIEVEHLVSRCITEGLSLVPRPSGLPRVLLTAADEEQHTLPLEALAAALAEQGVPCRLLGARVPPRALGDAVRRTGPAAVVVWSHTTGTADIAQLNALLTGPQRPLLVAAAGPGWSLDKIPDEVPLLTNLRDAARVVTAAAADR